MKDYQHGAIFCKCSTRMHCKGHHFKIFEGTPKKKRCPNCNKNRPVMVRKEKKKLCLKLHTN